MNSAHGGMLVELNQQIANDIMSLAELASDPDWQGYSLIARVDDESIAAQAYRYQDGQLPQPTGTLQNPAVLWDLRNATRDNDGIPWDMVIVKIDRASGQMVMGFLVGEETLQWPLTNEAVDRVSEALRPTPADFAG